MQYSTRGCIEDLKLKMIKKGNLSSEVLVKVGKIERTNFLTLSGSDGYICKSLPRELTGHGKHPLPTIQEDATCGHQY